MIQVHTTIAMLQGPVSDSDDHMDNSDNDKHASGDRKDKSGDNGEGPGDAETVACIGSYGSSSTALQ